MSSLPPLLPPRWRSSYVSYFDPMRADDRITSGHAWFDYERGVSRIDGFVNPWDEQAAGHRLWVSEINWFAGRCRRVRLAYAVTPAGVRARRLEDSDVPSPGPALARDLLRAGAARASAPVALMGREAVPWVLAGARPTTVFLCARTGLLLRVCIEKAPQRVSTRDFLTVDDHPISPDVFSPAAWPEVES